MEFKFGEKPSRPSKARPKKTDSKNLRVEALKVTIEKKKQCNSKALEIVANLSENTLDEEALEKALHFIDQEHYQDIVEERSINKLCGYSLCSNKLKIVLAQQYHISTIHNKVFDITERKNFCSNTCYKASKYLKDQILTSPLWLRDDTTTKYRFLSLQSKGGFAGEEVDLGVLSLKADIDPYLLKDTKSNSGNPLQENCSSTSPENKISENVMPSLILEQTVTGNDNTSEASTEISATELKHNDSCLESKTSVNSLSQDTELLITEVGNKTSNENSLDHESVAVSVLDTSKDNEMNNFETGRDIKCPVKKLSVAKCKKQDGKSSSVIASQCLLSPCENENAAEPSSSPLVESIVNTQSIVDKEKNSLKTKSKKKSKKPLSCPLQTAVIKVEHILREWFTLESLCFTFSEERVKEMLAEKGNQIKERSSVAGGCLMDVRFYERYLAVCKKLNVLELEDSKVDSSFREDVKKPLPDFEVLKKESEELELKVKMFYKGDKVVQFDDSSIDNSERKESTLPQEPVLPLVDLHAQKALRRRIVLDKLRKILQDLQQSIGLKGFNLGEDVRSLVSTFNLSAHNITMKPAEWNLIAIVVIKLLSLKEKALEQSLNSHSSTKHLTLLMMSYSLDVGYLDRLISWLTDIDALLQKQ